MKTISFSTLFCALGLLLVSGLSLRANNEVPLSEAELSKNGVFGFPQAQAQVLCETPDLRLSVWNNDEYLYAQAIVWKDDSAEFGKLRDGRATCDYASIVLDLDADGQLTKDVDRIYMLSPWPVLPGLRYSVAKGQDGKWATTPLLSDTHGRGAVRYVLTPEGRKIRVDSFLIPLTEISRKVGDKIRLVYHAYSPHPDLTLNSGGYIPQPPHGPHYANYDIPMASYHDYLLAKGGSFSPDSVPDGHEDAPSTPPRRR